LLRENAMPIEEELFLLIKSKYPVVFLETLDEDHALQEIQTLARRERLDYYQWSLSAGLRRGKNPNVYYQSQDPTCMLRIAQELLVHPNPGWTVFVLQDFDKHLAEELVSRLFKDLVSLARNTQTTFIILAPEYNLPKDIEANAARLVGGYPGETEIVELIKQTARELQAGERPARRSLLALTVADLNRIAAALKGLSISQIKMVVNQCILADGVLDIGDLAYIEQQKKKIFDQAGWLEFVLSENRENLANFDNLKRWLAERRAGFSGADRYGLPPPKGLLLMGVQGCGKSLAVKIIARELGIPLYRLDVGSLYSKYIGETEQNLRKALAIAEKLAPLCLWIDEIEKAFSSSDQDMDGGVSQRVMGAFLTWLQERQSRCFLAATANDVQRLPLELLRKGRFDEIFFVDLPDNPARAEIFRIQLRKRNLNPAAFDLTVLAELTPDFSGAEIEQLVIAALYQASAEQRRIATAHLVEQIRATKTLAQLKQEEIAALRAWARERTVPA
jgi:SpoVK/Ycf46/Vps4 family AAA+-type ATPase